MAIVCNPELIHTNCPSRRGNEGELIHTNCRIEFFRMVKIISGRYSNFFAELICYISYHINSNSRERERDSAWTGGGR
jgi:hypothetical protein